MDWFGLGSMTVTPFLCINHCNTVDAVSSKFNFKPSGFYHD